MNRTKLVLGAVILGSTLLAGFAPAMLKSISCLLTFRL